MNIIDLLRAAGPLILVLTALSVYVIYVAALRMQVLSRLSADPTLVFTRVHAALMQQDLDGARREAGRLPTPAGNVLRAGLERAPAGPDSAAAAMNEALLIEDRRAFAGLGTLGTVAQLAPLLGLLGTVVGMVRAFMVFSTTANPSPELLATGISEALVNTGGGLVVAVTAYFLRGYLRGRAESIMLHAERIRETLPAWLVEMQLRRDGVLVGAPLQVYETEPAAPILTKAARA